MHRLIAILRRIEPRAALVTTVEGLVDDGVRLLEITFDAPDAADDVRAVREHLSARDHGGVLVGAGTVMTAAQLDAARSAGASFAVSPVTDPRLIERSVDLGLPFLPGAMTPTEVAIGWGSGATFVKVFPASSVGPMHLRDLHGPFREIELVATGGVDGGNAADFISCGAVAVGVGSWLTGATHEERRRLVTSLDRSV